MSDDIAENTPQIGESIAAPSLSEAATYPEGERAIKHGTLGEMGKTLAEQIASGYTVGASELAEQALLKNAKEREARTEENPITSFVGQGLGILGAHLTGPGEIEDIGRLAQAGRFALNPVKGLSRMGEAVAEKAIPTFAKGDLTQGIGLLGTMGQGAIGGAAEVGAYGAIQAPLHELSLGDPNINASKLVSDVGMGALYGAAFGAPLGLLGGALKHYRLPIVSEEVLIEHPTGKASGIAQAATAVAIEGEEVKGLPQKSALLKALKEVGDLEHPVSEQQKFSLDNPMNLDTYKTLREMDTPAAQEVRNLEVNQKAELTSKTEETIKNIAPEERRPNITSDKVEGGDRTNELFTKTYEAKQAELGPMFEALKVIDTGTSDHLVTILENITQKLPELANMFTHEGADVYVKPKYSSAWGLDEAVYKAVKQMVDALKESPEDFRTLQNIRLGLTQHIDKLASGKGPSQIRAIQAGFMDYLNNLADAHATRSGQKIIDKNGVPLSAREINAQYAKLENQREVIESKFGASVGKKEYGEISRVKPEKINDKIFGNTAHVEAAKNILSKEDFREILSNWLSAQKELVTDNGVFSGNKWGTFLKKNKDVLNAAFSDHPQDLNRLRNLNTISRILPDAPSINPSGTAKTAAGIIKEKLKDTYSNPLAWLHPVEALGKVGIESLYDYLKKAHVEFAFKNMTENAEKAGVLSKVAEGIKESDNKLMSAAKSVFSGSKGPHVEALAWPLASYKKNADQIRKLANDPNALQSALEKSTEDLYHVAPALSQQIQNQMVAGVMFLDSKLPKPQSQNILDAKTWEPSTAEKGKFLEYYRTVDDPVSSLRQVKNGGFSNQNMEVMTTVYPALLNEMRGKVMEHFDEAKGRNLNYAQIIALSKFMGQPLQSGLMMPAIMANQNSFTPPSPPSGAGQPSGGRAKNLDVAGRARTRSEKEE